MNREKSSPILRLLRWFCPAHLLEEIEGDLQQKFERDSKQFGLRKAKRKFVWNVIAHFRLEIIFRHKSHRKTNMFPMILHNLRFGTRHLLRQPLNSGIHIIGLTLGISVCLTIGLLLRHEFTYDDYHRKENRIFRVNASFPAQDFNIYATPILLADEIRQHASGVERVALALPQFTSTVWISQEKVFKQSQVIIAEPTFIDIFKFEPIVGDFHKALKKPYTALLSESTASKFFGNDNPVGKSFKFRNEFNITVEGVYKDLPSNTNLPVSAILSYVDNVKYLNNGDTWYFGQSPWVKLQACTYLLLEQRQDLEAFQTQLNRIAEKNINSSPEVDKDVKGQFLLQSLSNIHLEPEFRGPWVRPIQPTWLWFFGGIGLIVLTLACINFLNLSTAQAMTRTREIGVRKVVGARKSQLMGQFLCETIILVFVAWVISVVLVKLFLPFINTLIEKQILFDLWSPQLLITIAASIIVVGLLSGIYPAWVVARIRPALNLKSGQMSIGGSWSRKSLVILQLGVSMVLLVIVVVTTRQVNYIKNLDLGVITKSVIGVEIPDRKRGQTFASELMRVPGVKVVSLARTQAVNDDHWWNGISANEESQSITACAIHADSHYLDVYGLKLITGTIPQDTYDTTKSKVNRVVVNENLLKSLDLGSAEEAIGKRFNWVGETQITGVISDFNTEPLRYALSPTLIVQDTSLYNMACIRLEKGSNVAAASKEIEALWKRTFPNEVFELKFLDDQVDGFYRSEEQLMSIFKIFAGIAIFISCLGIWGLAAFDIMSRTKEISIRKVLGATVSNVIKLLSGQFLRLVLISCLVALPISYYGISRFLDLFAYKVNVGWWFYALPALALLFLTMLTISILTIRAALMNPADNLRSE